MRYLVVLLALAVLTCTACGAPGDTTSSTSPTAVSPTPGPTGPTPWPTPRPKQPGRPPVYVLIHIWYISGAENCPSVGNPKDHWGPWIWTRQIDDPCVTIPGAPWLRQISSNAYPLTGAYDSRNPDILRWQIRQAKAAGIDGFFVCLYTWAPHFRYLFDLFFGTATTKGMLQIAQEENFKLAIEGWESQGNRNWESEIGRQLAAVDASPYKDAYIHLDGRPVYWLMYPRYMTGQDRIAFLDGTWNSPRRVNWIFRNSHIEDSVALNKVMVNSRAQFPSEYNFPTVKGGNTYADFQANIAETQSHSVLDMHPIAHAYGVGYDERFGKLADPSFKGRYIPRDGTACLSTFLEESARVKADFILIESWNEWGEGSMIEAGVNIEPWRVMGQEHDLYMDKVLDKVTNKYVDADAPFKYLDVLCKFNGMTDEKGECVHPQPPPCSAFDPLMRERSLAGPPETRCIDKK